MMCDAISNIQPRFNPVCKNKHIQPTNNVIIITYNTVLLLTSKVDMLTYY